MFLFLQKFILEVTMKCKSQSSTLQKSFMEQTIQLINETNERYTKCSNKQKYQRNASIAKKVKCHLHS